MSSGTRTVRGRRPSYRLFPGTVRCPSSGRVINNRFWHLPKPDEAQRSADWTCHSFHEANEYVSSAGSFRDFDRCKTSLSVDLYTLRVRYTFAYGKNHVAHDNQNGTPPMNMHATMSACATPISVQTPSPLHTDKPGWPKETLAVLHSRMYTSKQSILHSLFPSRLRSHSMPTPVHSLRDPLAWATWSAARFSSALAVVLSMSRATRAVALAAAARFSTEDADEEDDMLGEA